MRKIISLLSEYRTVQLEAAQAAPTRIAETRQMFDWMDQSLSGIKPTDPLNRLEEVMVSADFTYAIQEFVQRKALPGYQQMTFEFEPLVKPDVLPNYLTVSRYQNRAGLDDLEYVGEKGQARAGYVSDATKRQYRVHRWEKQFDFSHEAMINDDIAYFENQAADMGRSARRTLEKFVSRFYTNATSRLLLTNAGAFYSTTGRLTTANISTARMAFGQRTDARGEPILADLNYVVYHRGLADTVATIQNSTLVPETGVFAQNVVRGTFMPIKDPYITGTAPNLPWYAFTNWTENNIIPFVLARRQGMPGPLILRKKSDIESVTSMLGAGAGLSPVMGDFHTRNIQMLVSDVWGTYIDATQGNIFDIRGAYYSSGTAP